MMQNISDKTLSDILGTDLAKNAVIDAKTQEAYTMIREAGGKKVGNMMRRKKKIRKRIFTGIVSAAAVFFLACAFCVMNPVIAREIPILGNLFMKVADVIPYGNLPKEDTINLYEGDSESLYQVADDTITVTLTEEYASNQAVYIGICVESTEEFPELVTLIESGAQFLEVRTKETYSFRPEEPISTRRRIDGKFEDAHTFIGVMRIDYSELIFDYRRYDKAVAEADAKGEEYPEFSIEEWADYYDIPSSFQMTLELTQIAGTLLNPTRPEGMKSEEELAQMSVEEMTEYMNSIPKEWIAFPNPYKYWYREGSWFFEIPVTQSEETGRLIELHEVNEEGCGIENIELSPVEMTVNDIRPVDVQISTWIVAFDSEGKEIRHTDSGDVFAVSGHDISTIYLYLCDFEEVGNARIKYDGPDNQKSYQELIEECAFMKVVVSPN